MDIFKKIAAQEAIKEAKDNEGLFMETADTTARVMKIYYDALISKGFNHKQALAIVIAHGTDYGGYGKQLNCQ